MSLTSEYWNIVVVQAETVEELKLALETKKAQGYLPITAEQRAGVEMALGVQLPLRSLILHRKAPGEPARYTADEACKLGSDGTVTERARTAHYARSENTHPLPETPKCECGCAKTREPHQKYCPLYGK